MAFPKFHGISLANNGFIENLRVERLAADPVPASAGRIWFNTTEKVLKFSSLDGAGAVVVQTFGTHAEIAALEAVVTVINGDSSTEGSFRKAIADLIGTAPEALDTLGEIATALNNDPNVYNTLVNLLNVGLDDLNQQILGTATTAMDTLGEVEAAITLIRSTIGDLTGLTTDTKTDLVAAINEVDSHADANAAAIAAETSRATAAEAQIASDLSDEVARATAAEQANAAAIAAETTRAQGVESALQAELDATQVGAGLGTDGAYAAPVGSNYLGTATSLKDADSKLDAALKAEADRAVAAEAQIASDLSAEVVRAQAAEGDLSTLATTAKGNLVSAINEVLSLAGDGTDALKGAINDQRFTFASAAPALQHVVAHGLNSGMVSVDVWTKGDDGLFRNDIVAVTLTDANTVTIDLTEARDVKVVVQSLADLA